MSRTPLATAPSSSIQSQLAGFALDAYQAARSLLRQRSLVALATLTLAVGLGGNVTMFSFFNGMYLRPLPYDDPETLVSIASVQRETGRRGGVSYPDVVDLRAQSAHLDPIATYRSEVMSLTGVERPERVVAVHVSPGALATLGVVPADGRLFRDEEGTRAAAPVALLSHRLWSTTFGGGDVIGRSLLLDGTPTTIVGILPADFSLLRLRPDVFLAERNEADGTDRGRRAYGVFARLASDTSLEQARLALDRLGRDLAAAYPVAHEGWRFELEPLHATVRPSNDLRRLIPVVFTAVGLVLLVACANVAGLLLARASSRRQELTVRAALGAGRGRLALGILSESAVLSLLGGALGVLLAQAGVRAILAAAPVRDLTLFHFGIDYRLLLFALAACAVTTVVASLAPTWQVVSSDLATALRSTGTSASRLRNRWGSTLVVAEIALAFVLLAAASVVIRGLDAMNARDLGFEPERLLTLRLDPPSARYPDDDSVERFFNAVDTRLAALPGVVAVGSTNDLTLTGADTVGSMTLPDRGDSSASTGTAARVSLRSVSPGYFEALDVPTVAGRGLDDRDRADGPPVAVVNEAWVRRWSPDGDAVGRQIIAWDDQPRQIVGVVRDIYEVRLDRPLQPVVYLPSAQVPVRDRSLLVRVDVGGRSERLAASVRQAVWRVDADQPIAELQPLREVVGRQAWVFKMATSLLAVFAAAAWALASVGIYSVTAYAVGKRIPEIGVRMALGSTRRGVLRLLLRETAVRSLIGIGLGLPVALLATRGIARVLFGVAPAGTLELTAIIILVLVTTSIACLVPARRAASIDPNLALRHD